MKKGVEPDGKASSVKGRDKVIRNRSKRQRCKRRKNVRLLKRCYAKEERLVGAIDKQQQQQEQQQQAFDVQDAAVPVDTANRARLPPVCSPYHIRMKQTQNVWIRAYQNIVKWQCQYQTNYWKQYALHLREENDRLRRRLPVPSHGETDDSTDEEDSDDGGELEYAVGERQTAVRRQSDSELDEEFLAFMEVSARHRRERSRLKNESVH